MQPKLLVIPAIDIKNGKCVRSVQGIPELDCYEYGDDPIEMAKIWRAENAKMIHIVDFDGAHELSKRNYKIIEEICSSVVIPVEFSGGIRNMEDAEIIMNTAISRLGINTLAVNNRKEFLKVFNKYGPSKIVITLDVQDEELIIKGRTTKSGIHYRNFTKEMVEVGIKRFIVCDITRNGTLNGPNIELSKEIAEITGARVTHAGGIRNKDELMDIQKLVSLGVDSVIVGRALYENRFPCQKLWRVAESGIFN
ncbi:MAG: 1-(5-phosphoribosyl)-5-[(5-phosphoribosylamino)methylideneamino] imidazole-4-carboxamide isomerase [Ignavibacteria bacterium]|nr:1-(5-phosphoribosyl)-5-[(5-phosphoribosylamino)methylideneamino] imidazole-4-carboxamide isomerase [Ignavibacteria bacterium]MBT8381323.1 1-(5-phosphoribosyl)-5-[(5-phosphoribosylamino)methylideneamino] imidazole-4-carboxamide isomerase [Ignavibacteria bacterium]MBT8391694.1 1-(5-phosphoribosyl)-5-[(5-phosphoribosylamino)methylideneamino] imidazole-4-carboxamide isomerase [Ignavibacteria bacterium]NNJ54236.1 1-(5-phosphoribosyl)-5-[(5-phosphoribosylamino)methylideneamino] imidazole-4-carboxam